MRARQRRAAARAAERMTFATAPGREMSDRCDALMLVVRALARLDMARCSLGGMTLSRVPINDPLAESRATRTLLLRRQ
jgi:hypothetical protein